ncbi:chromophore lyase CpcT/CpeT [Tumidithrix helvetica PCC 7403]|uniref:chromophore lyase CpcT/CpeT n=1 Tax=Tumidithrix helvetica TaxID=3457545 RepID=UPI003C8C42DE
MTTIQTTPADVFTLASWLAGDFSNWEQAIENPPFFAHIRVCIRPLPVIPSTEPPEGVWLYSEQSYDFELNHPYRTAILNIVSRGDHLEIVNYKLKEAEKYFGASRQPDRLQELTPEQLDKLCGCTMLVHRTENNTFKGAIEPGKQCCVVRKGKSTYLVNEFEVGEHFFSSLDRGHDPETDERVWGSVAGPFEFTKKTSFATEVRSHEVSSV